MYKAYCNYQKPLDCPRPQEPQKDQYGRSFRGMAEAKHLRDQRRLFVEPFMFEPDPKSPSTTEDALLALANDADGLVRWEHIRSNETICKTVSQLTPEDCRYFCFKACALYIVSATQSPPNRRMRL